MFPFFYLLINRSFITILNILTYKIQMVRLTQIKINNKNSIINVDLNKFKKLYYININ